MAQTNNNDTDDLLLWLIGIPLAAVLLPTILGNLLPPVQAALVGWHVLVADNVLVPIGAGTGLDLGRCLIAAALVAIAISLLVLIIRRRAVDRQR